MSKNNQKIEEVDVDVLEMNMPVDAIIFDNKGVKAKSTAFTFDFPDGKQGILTITKRTNFGWIPRQDISKIIVVFTPKELKQ